jgi:hypothetical protein
MYRFIPAALAAITISLVGCTTQQRLQNEWDDLTSAERANMCAAWYQAPSIIDRAYAQLKDHDGVSLAELRTFLKDHC